MCFSKSILFRENYIWSGKNPVAILFLSNHTMVTPVLAELIYNWFTFKANAGFITGSCWAHNCVYIGHIIWLKQNLVALILQCSTHKGTRIYATACFLVDIFIELDIQFYMDLIVMIGLFWISMRRPISIISELFHLLDKPCSTNITTLH